VVNPDGGSVAGNEITWSITDTDIALTTLYDGEDYESKQCIDKTYTLRYESANDFNVTGKLLSNRISATGTHGVIYGPVGEPIDLNETIGEPQHGVYMFKYASDVLPSPIGDDLVWHIDADLRYSNAPVPNLVLYETLPTTPEGLSVKSVTSGGWNSPVTTGGVSDVRARISYSTESNVSCDAASYTDLSGGFIVSPASPIIYENPTLPDNTTCIRWEFQDYGPDGPAVPRDWRFTSSPILSQDTIGYAGAFPVEVENCVNATYQNFDLSTGRTGFRCVTATIEEPTPELRVSKSVTPSSGLKPGDLTEVILRFNHDAEGSTGPTINPVMTDLLPEVFEFVSWDSVGGLDGQPYPNLEVINDFNATGRTLLRFSWADTAPAGSVDLNNSAGMSNPASFAVGSDIFIRFTTRVKAGTPAGTYTNQTQFYDNSPRFTCYRDTEVDTHDFDGDGNITEKLCQGENTASVITAAVLGGEKWIKGDPTLEHVDSLDPSPAANVACPDYNGFTRYPCVAQTTKGGDFEYLLRVVNTGNVNLDEYILYDVLPDINDTGVGQPLLTDLRGTQWRPELQAEITAENTLATAALAEGGVIEYSTSSNPCRPEVSSSSTESPVDHWQPGCDDDWGAAPADLSRVTAFRIRLPFDTAWQPGEELQFGVHLKAPEIAPRSDVTNASDMFPAWNSLAHRVTQASNGSRLSTAEPRKVGIVVPKEPEVSIGSVVWEDTNNNGLQEAGETGIDGVTVTLLDETGDSVYDQDGNLVTPQLTQSGGQYFFDNLDEGNYTVQVTPPAGMYAPSSVQNGADNDDTEGDSNIKGSGATAGTYVSGVFELTDNDEPVNANEISALPNNGDNADDTNDDNGNMTVDFGFIPLGSPDDVVGNLSGNVSHENADGLHPLEGVTIILLDENGQEVARTTTNANGDYTFTELVPGLYIVREVQPDNYYNVRENEGGADDDNTTVTSENEISANVGAGENDISNDFVEEQAASLGDYVWYDDDEDGIQDDSEEGVNNVRVYLLNEDGERIQDQNGADIYTETNTTGGYLFTGLEPNLTYAVEFDLNTLPDGFEVTLQDEGGDETQDSDADLETGVTESVTLDPGQHYPDLDMGIKPSFAHIGDYFWIDSNQNGIQDEGEEPVVGAVVELFDAEGNPVADVYGHQRLVTDENGRYGFDVEPGTYQVRFTIPDTGYEGYEFSSENQGENDGIDTDVNGVGYTQMLDVVAGDNILTLDAGINCGCQNVSTDSVDTMSLLDMMAMFFVTLAIGLLFIRRKEIRV
jgi:hypothetical protein